MALPTTYLTENKYISLWRSTSISCTLLLVLIPEDMLVGAYSSILALQLLRSICTAS
jgi:hypothetical protein